MRRQAMTTATAMLVSSFALGFLFASPFAFLGDLKIASQFALFLTAGLFIVYGVLGLPIHLLLQRKQLLSVRSYAIAGGAVGLLLSPLARLLDTDVPPDEFSVASAARAAAMFSSFACVAATTFWCSLRILRRPS
jgi:hypothetical protein